MNYVLGTPFFSAIALATLLMREPLAAEALPLVEAVIDYSSEKGDDAADRFFETLNLNSGKTVQLDLEIIPRQDPDLPGYSLRTDPEPPAESEFILRGTTYGLVDNYRTRFSVSFQHPSHFHNPIEIRIGNRMAFPFHSIVCGAENSGSMELTRLHVRGHFVVETAEIPTALVYDLYPYDP